MKRLKKPIFKATLCTLVLVLAGLLFFVSKRIHKHDHRNTNLILISIDTLGADHLGCYGYPRNTSPNIDRFAKENITFRNFFTVVPKTAPAMASFMTGKNMSNHGVLCNLKRINKEEDLLAEILPKSYEKVAFINNPILFYPSGFHAGFDHFNEFHMVKPKQLTDSVIDWLEKNHNKKFFLWIHYLDPHGPYKPPKKYTGLFVNDAYYDRTTKVPISPNPEQGIGKGNAGFKHVPKYQVLGNNDKLGYYIAQYDAEIYNVDKQVNRLFELFEKYELYDNSIIVLTADHGESLGEDEYYFEHGLLLNQGSIHIPFIMSHPNIKNTKVIQALADNTDFLPTMISLLGLKVSKQFDGVNLTKLLKGNSQEAKPYIVSETPLSYTEYQQAVIGNDFKFVKSGKIERPHPRVFKRQNEAIYSYYRISKNKVGSVNMIDQVDEKEKLKLIHIIAQLGNDSLQLQEADFSSKICKALLSLGYVQ